MGAFSLLKVLKIFWKVGSVPNSLLFTITGCKFLMDIDENTIWLMVLTYRQI